MTLYTIYSPPTPLLRKHTFCADLYGTEGELQHCEENLVAIRYTMQPREGWDCGRLEQVHLTSIAS